MNIYFSATATATAIALLVAGCNSTPASSSDNDSIATDVSTRDGETTADTQTDTTTLPPSPTIYPQPTGLTGHRTTTLPFRDGTLTAELWYPATESSTEPLTTFETGERQSILQTLIDGDGSGCHTSALTQQLNAPPALGDWPLVLFSHCYGCTRWSSATVATELASAGYIVLSVDHDGTTLWDQLDESSLPLDNDTLTLRTDQLEALYNQRLSLTSDLTSNPSPDTYGWGHSFGVATTVNLAIRQPTIRAIAAHAAPLANPLFTPTIDNVTSPFLLLVAQEDNSIQEIGNRFMRLNFADSTQPGWLAELADAGHWSVSDILNLTPALAPGCGNATRQTNNDPFTYLTPATARSLTAQLTRAFFDTVRTSQPSLSPSLQSSFAVFETRDLPTTP